MNVSRSLTFLWTSWTLAVSLLAILVTAAFCFIAWRRSGYKTKYGLLELTRLALVIMAAVLLNQPEWVEEFRPEEKPSMLVLWDDSGSMGTRDALDPSKPGSAPETRHDAAAPLTLSSTWSKLRERMNVVIQPFSSSEPGRGSDLYDPLATAPETIPNLRGIVLVSDGDWNEGPPPAQAASNLRMKNVPVFAVPVGSSPQDFDAFMHAEAAKWGPILKQANIRVE